MRRTRILFIIILLLAFNQAIAQESMMPEVSFEYLEKLVKIAKENYPKAKMYQARVKVAETSIEKAKWSFLDVLTFSYLYSPNNSITIVNPSLLNGSQVGVFLNVGSFLQKPAMLKQAKEEKNVYQYDKEANDLNIESEVKQRYYAYIQQLTILKVRSQSVLDVESMMKDVKYRYQKGEETLSEYNKVLVLYANNVQEKINTEASMLAAKASLEELLGKKLEDIK